MEKSKSNDAGPAFPLNDERLPSHEGMSLRDWFAGQALASIPLRSWGDPTPDDVIQQWAKAAYAISDAMIEERSKP